MSFLFWLAFSLIVIHYFIYGLIIYVLSMFFAKKCVYGKELPTISFIVAAYNEEKVIEEKILNTLRIDYPKELVEVIVVF